MGAAVSKSRFVRQVALLALGALAVHQARYGLALAAGAHEAGGGHRHAYLELLAPALAFATCAAVAVSLLAAAVRRRLPRSALGVTERAALYAAALVAVYVVQEFSESLLAGNIGALASAFGTGSWLVVPLGMAFGAAVALVGRLLDRAELRLAVGPRVQRPRAPRRIATPRTAHVQSLASQTLAFGFARRPPPSPALSG
jgi:hypothetical protein